MSFDPYRKWLGIPANKRTPNFYDVLGIAEGENDIDVIRNAIQQRRAFVQSKRGEGHDDSVKVLLRLFEEAAATLLVPEFKTRYDQQLGLYLKRKRTGNRRSYILPSWMESRIVRVYGEGSGIVGDLFGIVAILFCAFALMAYLSFGLQTQTSKNSAASEPTWLERMVLGVSGDNSSRAEGQSDSSVSSKNPIQFQVDELRSKVTKWQESQEKLKRLIESLEDDRKTILGKLDQFTRNKSNAENSPEAKVLATELNEILSQSDACRSKLKDYELAILKSESKLRSIERQLAVSEAGVSEVELRELAAAVMELDESLSDQDTVSAIAATLDNRTTKMLDEFRGEQKKTEQSTWKDRVANVPAAQQADDVRKKLMELNPGFDGKMDTKISGGASESLSSERSLREPSNATEPKFAPADAVIFNGHAYKVFREAKTWHQAKRRCQDMGGHLATISSSEEDQFVSNLAKKEIQTIGKMDGIWLGATDEEKEDEWKWIDRTAFSFTNWGPGQPNNKQDAEHYLLLYLAGNNWSDQPDRSEQHTAYFACEWDESKVVPLVPKASSSSPDRATGAVSSKSNLLFNGVSFEGLRFVAAPLQAPKPRLQDSWGTDPERKVLFATGNGNSWLATQAKFENFKLEFELRFPPNGKISPNGSGVVLGVNGINETGYDPRGIEIDLSGSERVGSFLCFDTAMSSSKGSTTNNGVGLLESTSKPNLKPIGNWNTTMIECRGREVAVFINGQMVNEGTADLVLSGEICFRSQNTAVEFREMRIATNGK